MTNIATISFPSATAPLAESFREWPVGWYVAARSDQLGRKPLGVDLFGRRLVCYRATNGQAVIMDARCWHMGADLSAGSVIDDQIVCPFHGWRYGCSGHCALVPTQADIPRFVKQRTYCIAESAGRVFVFSSPVSQYPLPFFAGIRPADLIAARPFEFVIRCPWWLVGTNGFDLQHFAGAHDRRLVEPPTIESPHPAARRIVSTFDVCGTNCRDRLTRRFAGERVTMDLTVWSGTLAFVVASFHNSVRSDSLTPGSTSYGMTEIRPIGSGPRGTRSLVRVTILRRRRPGFRAIDWLDVQVKRHFIRAFLTPDIRVLDTARYDPDHLIDADRQMIDYLRWLVTASGSEPSYKELL
jgi:phenylpropionate dioxygenase-like ring-hydroxylating dioxygenase large terminal subunit